MAPTMVAGAASDAASVADVFLEAMAPNALQRAQFPDPAGERFVRDWFAQDVVRHVQDADKGLLVARSEDGEIISFVKWLVHSPRASQEAPEEQDVWPETSNIKVLETYTALTAKVREDVLGQTAYYHVSYLCTKPGHTGQGAASGLLKLVQERASKDGMAVILESTMNVVSFYERLGFRVALKFDLLLPPPGGQWTELYEERSMVWKPDGKG
ncbi:uncharacterized protein F5Z01DRAFT_436293 [Emericellopsis atlantica]|uniref:N-acetyltransferase domain-containing protein n=1 Tax=Emericellopsis atlantica TaxID=2614577 RepID=A0A9P8CJY5_9HYPO|nr:uncharacterized protein F5Z01DRAFT_436293 [Emericellopsis atlantica]KAG9249959.1 hypothetical protein F5Z01DRAFT_436293 [Emericellopsis atlantica]